MKHFETLSELFAYAEADNETKVLVEEKAKEYGATHVAFFRNMQMDSSEFGDSSFLSVGPNNTYKTPEDCLDKWLNDLPSQRQYAEAYAPISPQSDLFD